MSIFHSRAIIKAEFEVNIASPNGNALRGLVTVEGVFCAVGQAAPSWLPRWRLLLPPQHLQDQRTEDAPQDANKQREHEFEDKHRLTSFPAKDWRVRPWQEIVYHKSEISVTRIQPLHVVLFLHHPTTRNKISTGSI